MIVTSELHTHKESRSRKQKRRLHPLAAKKKTQNRKMLRHGRVPLRGKEQGGGKRKNTSATEGVEGQAQCSTNCGTCGWGAMASGHEQPKEAD